MKAEFNKYVTKESFESYKETGESKELNEEIIKYLGELALNGFLKEIEYSELHKTNFTYAWNKFVNGEISLENDEDYLMNDVMWFVKKIIIYNVNKEKGYKKETEYEEFIEFLNNGNIPSFSTPEGQCFNCSRHLSLEFENWTGTLKEFKKILDEKNYKNVVKKDSPLSYINEMDYFPANECFDEFVKIKDIEITEKEMLITDWIRIEEFNDVVEKDGSRFTFDISSAKGRSEQFEHYLSLGFISISTLSGLSVYTSKDKELKNSFIFGKENYDSNDNGYESNGSIKGLKEEGTINHGLRATTIIGLDKLMEIINIKVQDIVKAKEIVNKYLEENKSEILIKKIKPGNYTLIFDNRIKDVSDLLFPQNISEAINPKIFMYPKELSLELQKKKKVKP